MPLGCPGLCLRGSRRPAVIPHRRPGVLWAELSGSHRGLCCRDGCPGPGPHACRRAGRGHDHGHGAFSALGGSRAPRGRRSPASAGHGGVPAGEGGTHTLGGISSRGGALLCLGEVWAKAHEICAFAVIFQFITLHLEQIKPERLQSVANFGRGRDKGRKGEAGSLLQDSGAKGAGPTGTRRAGASVPLPNPVLPVPGMHRALRRPARCRRSFAAALLSVQGRKSRASCV